MGKRVVLGLVALVLAYVGLGLALGARTKQRADGFDAELRRLAALADTVNFSSDEPLGEACAKAPRVSPTELVAYFLPPDELVLSAALAKERYHGGQFKSFDPEDFDVGSATVDARPWSALRWAEEFLGDTPDRWAWQSTNWKREFHHDVADAKYLVVHRLDRVELPRVGADSYEPGSMSFRSAVLDAKSGVVVCEGRTAMEQRGSIPVAGSGPTEREAQQRLEERKEDQVLSMFFIDLHFFALRDVCWLGDEKLCEATFGAFQP